MAARENFRLEARLAVSADNIAIDAILMVIEDTFGRGSVKSGPDDDGNIVADVHCAAAEIDARRVNSLHEQLASLAKYILEPADVTCSDDTGREQSYRLEPAALDVRSAQRDGTGETPADLPDGATEVTSEQVAGESPGTGTDGDAVVETAESED